MKYLRIALGALMICCFGSLQTISPISKISEIIKTPLAGSPIFPNEIHKKWQQTQKDPVVEASAKIVNTVNAFIIVMYESHLNEKLFDFGFLFNLSDVSSFEDYSYERGLLHLRLAGWIHSNSKTLLKSYNYRPLFSKVSILNGQAKVLMKPNTTVIYKDDPDHRYDHAWKDFEFELVFRNGAWLIHQVKCLDIEYYSHPRGSDFNKLAATLIERDEADKASEEAESTKLFRDTAIAFRALFSETDVVPLGFRPWSSFRCRTYALDYALDYNALFRSYSPTDCANFVSQCIWYGFWGQNDVDPIENHDLPMIDDDIDAITWWCDSEGTGIWNTKYCWTYVDHFLYMIQTNFQYNRVGLQGYWGSMPYVIIGDVVKHRTLSHVYIVSNIIDYNRNNMTDWNEIYVSAHTTDRKDERLSLIFSSSSSVRFYLITGFKDPS